MRTANQLPIRRVIRGTDWNRHPYTPHKFPVSPAIADLLSRPAWSVRTLLPPSHNNTTTPTATPATGTTTTTKPESLPSATEAEHEITREKLHHLLRLSALPLPKSTAEENQMLQTLRDQVHFVKAIQSVDTTNVKPLVTVRDETSEAVREQTITLEKMMPYLALEEKVGKNGTVRRRDVVRTPEQDREDRATWEVDVGQLGEGSDRRRRGRYFFVKRGKQSSKEEANDKPAGEKAKGVVGEKPGS